MKLFPLGLLLFVLSIGCVMHKHVAPATPAHAVSERPVLAFYYPWYEPEDWSYDIMSDLPVPHYSSGDDETMLRHIQQADDMGIDALICAWYGPDEPRLDGRCRRLQQLALESGSDVHIAIIVEQSAWEPLRSVEALAYALDVLERDFMSQPNYFTFKGRPAVFWFQPPALGGIDVWLRLREQVDPHHQQFWFGGTDIPPYMEVFDTLYFFDITWEYTPGAGMAAYKALIGERFPFIATAMPGYDDLRIRPDGHQRGREHGAYYQGTWARAVEYNAEAVIIVSFNEFLEGTHIEPSEQFGDLYVNLTREYIAYFRAHTGQPAQHTGSPHAETEGPGPPSDDGPSAEQQPSPEPPPNAEQQPNAAEQTIHEQESVFQVYPGGGLKPPAPPPADDVQERESVPQSTDEAQRVPEWQPAQPCNHFPQTGFDVCGRFLVFWQSHGGVDILGLPISPQQEEQVDGGHRQIQHFERCSLELHPENAPPYDVILWRLGVEMLTHQGRDWLSFEKVDGGAEGCLFFAETGHSICEPFLSFWRSQGIEVDGTAGYSIQENILFFGFPLSEPQNELLSDGYMHSVQWFERTRLEYHPDMPEPFQVMPSLLGQELYEIAKGGN